MKPISSKVPAAVDSPSKYQRRAVRVRSATGPQRNRHKLADTPMATMEGGHGDGKAGSCQNERQANGNKTAADPVGQDQKKECGWSGGFKPPHARSLGPLPSAQPVVHPVRRRSQRMDAVLVTPDEMECCPGNCGQQRRDQRPMSDCSV